MTRITWNAPGERFFESGVDQGVLYPRGVAGVPWNGLVSVNETPTGGEVSPRYLDGVKYLDEMSSEEFAATISAFTYPEEFAACDGTSSSGKGLSFGQQRRKPFDLVYRTGKGNDTVSLDLGYKIHLVYNAKATPSSKAYSTIKQTTDASNFSWNIVTTPIPIPGLRPLSHLIIDSTKTDSYLLAVIEDILYGTDEDDPRMPTPLELKTLVEEWLTLVITDEGDGTWTAEGPDDLFNFPADEDGIFELNWPSVVQTGDGTYTISSQ